MTALEQRLVPVRGQVVRTLTGGAGASSVLLIASPVVSADVYRRTARCLCTGARVAVVDLPGSGRASRVRRPLGMEALAEFVPELLDALDQPSAVLIGHSNSGPIALLAALRHRHRVAGLVLADSIGAHPSASLWPIFAGRAIDACLEPRLTLTGWPAVANNLMRHTRHFLHQVAGAAGDAWLAAAAGVQVPTLLAWGRRDHTMPIEAAERFSRAMVHAERAFSDTGSHDWLIEQPDRFAAAVLGWMERQRTSG